jgi:hypothetical protein
VHLAKVFESHSKSIRRVGVVDHNHGQAARVVNGDDLTATRNGFDVARRTRYSNGIFAKLNAHFHRQGEIYGVIGTGQRSYYVQFLPSETNLPHSSGKIANGAMIHHGHSAVSRCGNLRRPLILAPHNCVTTSATLKESRLRLEIIFHCFVIVKVIAGKVCEDAHIEAQGINTVLHECVTRYLERNDRPHGKWIPFGEIGAQRSSELGSRGRSTNIGQCADSRGISLKMT